ncbi:hypothetical protein C1G86_1578 [Dehalococcoides mccartyi]|uniref:Uncharacterized protein n=1 Tax=Dehalococcoides mccartyi TaxID=61435 RepID=A0A328EJT9_9CHLR|nr:hypothetical protein C1G87_1611 [Dehalococcoides mccartyi]RAL70051.1 hypothetical protein C1G86_1578 [Dehalococcoides mccartyi]
MPVRQDPPVAGWYVDPRTGQRIFYDSNTEKFYTLLAVSISLSVI